MHPGKGKFRYSAVTWFIRATHIKLVFENRNMISVRKYAYGIPCPHLTFLAVITALAIIAYRLTDHKAQESSHANAAVCNMYEGQWVYDEKAYPMYKGRQCSLISGEFDCEQYGRKEFKYQHWRWQPHDCDLPRFDGKAFLEKIRGKKLYFVGDSVNRNQWYSLLCLVEPSLSPSSREIIEDEHKHMLRLEAMEYNATIGFFWAPFLAKMYHFGEPHVIKIKEIEKNAEHWTDADILIFDCYAWWRTQNVSLLWGSSGSPDPKIYKRLEDRLHGYELALNTWSDWLEININRTKTKLFLMSPSPVHIIDSGEGFKWTGEICYNETEPFSQGRKVGYNITDIGIMQIVKSRLRTLEDRGVKVQYIDITYMSSFRKDAHPSVYKKFNDTTSHAKRSPRSYSDCMHWCLPGLPDTWNQILYTYIMAY